MAATVSLRCLLLAWIKSELEKAVSRAVLVCLMAAQVCDTACSSACLVKPVMPAGDCRI